MRKWKNKITKYFNQYLQTNTKKIAAAALAQQEKENKPS
jgi:hypothetical protein